LNVIKADITEIVFADFHERHGVPGGSETVKPLTIGIVVKPSPILSQTNGFSITPPFYHLTASRSTIAYLFLHTTPTVKVPMSLYSDLTSAIDPFPYN
jgi:hypothetical protein